MISIIRNGNEISIGEIYPQIQQHHYLPLLDDLSRQLPLASLSPLGPYMMRYAAGQSH